MKESALKRSRFQIHKLPISVLWQTKHREEKIAYHIAIVKSISMDWGNITLLLESKSLILVKSFQSIVENFWVKLAGTVQLIWDLSSYELHLADLKDKKKRRKQWVMIKDSRKSRFCLPIVKRYATKLKRYRITLHDQLKITLTPKCTSRSKTNGKNEIPHFLNREHPHSMKPQSSYCRAWN